MKIAYHPTVPSPPQAITLSSFLSLCFSNLLSKKKHLNTFKILETQENRFTQISDHLWLDQIHCLDANSF